MLAPIPKTPNTKISGISYIGVLSGYYGTVTNKCHYGVASGGLNRKDTIVEISYNCIHFVRFLAQIVTGSF